MAFTQGFLHQISLHAVCHVSSARRTPTHMPTPQLLDLWTETLFIHCNTDALAKCLTLKVWYDRDEKQLIMV